MRVWDTSAILRVPVHMIRQQARHVGEAGDVDSRAVVVEGSSPLLLSPIFHFPLAVLQDRKVGKP